MPRYSKRSHGRPLLFKLIANKTSTTTKTNRKSIITFVKTYEIEISCKGGVISDVVNFF